MWSSTRYQSIGSCPTFGYGSPETAPLSRRYAYRLLLHFKKFSRDHIIFNMEIE